MARVSIYVSDELKARMDAAEDGINWSEVARACFEKALDNQHIDVTDDSPTNLARWQRMPYPTMLMDNFFTIADGRRIDLLDIIRPLLNAHIEASRKPPVS